jgi:hypothetical protein
VATTQLCLSEDRDLEGRSLWPSQISSNLRKIPCIPSFNIAQVPSFLLFLHHSSLCLGQKIKGGYTSSQFCSDVASGSKRVQAFLSNHILVPVPPLASRHRDGSRNQSSRRNGVSATAEPVVHHPAQPISALTARASPVLQGAVVRWPRIPIPKDSPCPTHLDNDSLFFVFHLQCLGKHAHKSLQWERELPKGSELAFSSFL